MIYAQNLLLRSLYFSRECKKGKRERKREYQWVKYYDQYKPTALGEYRGKVPNPAWDMQGMSLEGYDR